MSTRTRMIAGLALALAVGLFGPTLVAVATHSGGGRSSISGRLTDQYGEPAQTCVGLFSDGPTRHLIDYAWSDTNGIYRFERVRYGTYVVGFAECQWPPGFIPEWWDDQPAFERADGIVIGYDEAPVTGIDAVLTEL